MNPRQKAVMEARQLMRLGTHDPVCVSCGESNPLRLVLPNGDHVTGKNRDPGLRAAVCASCHLERHFIAQQQGIKFGRCESRVQARTAARLRALGSFLQMVAQYLFRWADELDEA
jgi:hypothetical protein